MNAAFLVALSVLAIVLTSAGAAQGQAVPRLSKVPAFVLWHEAEQVTTARKDVEKVIDERAPASGGKILYSPTMNHEGDVVTFKLDLPQDGTSGQVIFRYARLHWEDSM